MKITDRFFLIACLALAPLWSARADQLTTLHSFNGPDGYVPQTGLTQGADGNFYGVTQGGGAYGYGVAFRISSSGSFAVLYSFGQSPTDPQKPFGRLTPGNDGNFYGTTTHGGANDYGTIYKMTPNGAVTVLHSMSFADGVGPTAGLLLGTDGNFYGTAPNGGTGSGPVGAGTVFKVTPAGTLTVLHNFTAAFANTNSDGQSPFGALALGADGNLYGTTFGGGQFGRGTLFVITTAGSFTSLYSFGAQAGDGSAPRTGLVPGDDGFFYGTCSQGGNSNHGTLFKMSTAGTAQSTSVQLVHTFSGVAPDGALPLSGLIQANNGKLYGMTASGGNYNGGIIYKWDGVFTPLASFGAQASDPAAPSDTLFQASDGAFYGTTGGGGAGGNGTIFKFGSAAPPPPAHISVTYEGKIRDRVGKGEAALAADGLADATFTVQLLAGSGTRQLTSLDLNRGDGNEWDTIPGNGKWVIGAAASFDGALLNANDGSLTLDVPDGASFPIFMSENGNLFSGGHSFTLTATFSDGTTATATVTTPSSNGLAPTTFTVNGSDQPAYPPTGTTVQGLADTVLEFAAKQIGNAGGLTVTVQATTTPNVESSWTPLPTATNGTMNYDPATNRFVLNTTNYQHEHSDPVYFRAVTSAQGYTPNSVSNVVGPFNLTSNKSRFTTALLFAANGPLSDFYFRAILSSVPSGTTVRVQSSTEPGNESAWNDLAASGSGGMNRSTNGNFPNDFLLLVDKLPTTKGIYFRAIASAPSGYVDSISNVVGPFDVTADNPPQVGLIPPQGLDGSGNGSDVDHPILVPAGTVNFAATAGGGDHPMASVHLLVNGGQVSESTDPNAQVYFGSFKAVPGVLYVLEGIAFDNLGAHARADSSAVFIRAVSSGSNAFVRRRGDAVSPLATSAGRIYHAVADGRWNDKNTWADENNQPGVPTDIDTADIGAHAIQDASGQVGSLTLNGGTIFGRGNLTVWDSMTVGTNGCSIQGGTIITIQASAVWNLLNDKDVVFDNVAQYFLNGKMNIHGTGGIVHAANVTSRGFINWQAMLSVPPDAAVNPAAGTRVLSAATLTDGGIINGSYHPLIGADGASLVGHDSGSLVGHDSGSLIGAKGGTVIAQGGGNVIAQGGGNVIAQGGGNVIAQGGGNVIATGGGNVIAAGGGNNSNARSAAPLTPDLSAATGYVKTGGELDLGSTFLFGSVTLSGGVLSGSGLIKGDLTNDGGFIAPGSSSTSGMIAVTGNFAQTAKGTTVIARSGSDPSQFDQLQIGGTASLDGNLEVKDINGYAPDATETFNPLGYSSATGSFASISSNSQITLNATGVVASVDPNMPAPKAGQPLNISTRMQVLSGDNALIAGFIVSGPGGSTKKVLIRGIGPSLANFGVAGTMSDPLLELHKADGSVVSNDNWQDGDTSQIPSGFAPSDPRESVIVATLAPGNYSAVLKGAHGETGVGLAEVYDLDSSSPAQLANISTRGFVNTGDNVMIGGFIVEGTEPTRVLVRAIGPSLAAFGVQNALPATTLELHDANGAVISNAGWRATQEAEIKATTIPPSNDNEAAILATLVPGNYTAVVRGKDDTTGIGLVEAYNLQ